MPAPPTASVLMPMTFPAASTSGPPELPGLIWASVWSHRLYWYLPPKPRYRLVLETMPWETLRSKPNGEPRAMTN